MNLKSFHIFFITVSTALAAFFGLWCLGQYRAADSASWLGAGLASFVVGLGLVVYGIWFVRKMRRVNG